MRRASALATLGVMALLVAGCTAAGVSPAPSGPATSLAPSPSPLPAGTHTSTSFQPPVTFTVPAGWEKPNDGPTYLQLRPVGSELTGIHFFRDAVAASQDPACPTTPEPGVGTTAAELVAWFGERPGLVVSEPKPVTTGGLPGFVVDIAITDGWLASCPFADGIPTVPLLVGDAGDLRWVVAGSERLRMYVLDLPGGGTVIVDVDAFDGDLFEDFAAAASPIVISLEFKLD